MDVGLRIKDNIVMSIFTAPTVRGKSYIVGASLQTF
jgi:hypothetical protein